MFIFFLNMMYSQNDLILEALEITAAHSGQTEKGFCMFQGISHFAGGTSVSLKKRKSKIL